MTVLKISLLDLLGQNAATTATAVAITDRQHFQDVLKTTLDQNNAADAANAASAAKSPAPDQTPVRASQKQSDSSQPAQTDSDAAAQANQELQKDDKAKAAAARAAARRMAAHADAGLAAQDAPATATSSDNSTPDAAAVGATAQTSAPEKSQGDDPDATTASAADAASAAQTAAIAAATVATTATPVAPPPIKAEDSSAAELATASPGGVGDLLTRTLDQPGANNPATGTTVAKSLAAKPEDQTSGGPSTASLTNDVVVAPNARDDGQGSGQGSNQQQSQTQSQNAGDQKQVDQGRDHQADGSQASAAPTPPPTTAPTSAPIVLQTPAAPGSLLTGVITPRADAAPTSDAETGQVGTPTGLGLSAGPGTLTSLRSSETPSAAPSPYAPAQQPLPIEQVALAIGRMTNGARSFSMQLNPEHLGSVDVRMEVDAKGKTKVAITAERPETLALLKLDSHHLVKALQDSGVAADQSSLNFSLREQNANTSGDRRSGSGSSRTAPGSNQTSATDTPDSEITPVRMSLSRHLYDIHA